MSSIRGEAGLCIRPPTRRYSRCRCRCPARPLAFAELDKINKANVTIRLREIKDDSEAKEEKKVLDAWLKLNTQQTDLRRELGDAVEALDDLA